jgi:hypothetical protein
MFEFLRRIPGMLGLKGKGRRAAPKGSAAEAPVDAASGGESSGPSRPRRPKSPSQRRSGPKPKSGGGRPKRKK